MIVEFSIDGDVQLSRNLRIFAEELDHLEPFHRGSIEIITQRTDEIFKGQGSSMAKSPAWQPLSERTLEARKKRLGHYKLTPNRPGILRWTGTLQEDRTTNWNDDYGELRFNAPYAGYHQRGGRNLPTRAIIDLDDKTNTSIIKELQKLINAKIKIFGRQF